jgi:phosphoglycerate dehydrogenase-like enzyme
MSLKVILNGNFGKTQIQQRVADMIADQALWVEDADAAIRALPSADALICPDRFYSAKIAEAVRNSAPKLRWIQLLTAGYDRAKQHGVPAHIAVCNAGPAYAPAVAMHAVALLLALQRRLPTILTNQKRHAWDRSCTAELTTPASSTIAVIGFGPIGREIGRLLRALGARVVAVTRRGLPDPNADEIVSGDHLRDVLKRADALVVAASSDDSTRGLIGERELSACKKTAVLVNIARGAIVDARALGAALRNGTIAGAGIDVTDPEPLPADDPLWDAPNLIVTPHCAGECGAIAGERIADLACENLRRFIDGASLMHVVQL